MPHFTLIAYRPNSSDYCRGCLMATSSSNLEIGHYTDLKQLAERVVEIEDFDAVAGLEYAETEITILCDGEVLDDLAYEDSDARQLDQEYYAFLGHARVSSKERKEAAETEKQRQAAIKAEADRIAQEAKKRESELATLAHLRAKYEDA